MIFFVLTYVCLQAHFLFFLTAWFFQVIPNVVFHYRQALALSIVLGLVCIMHIACHLLEPSFFCRKLGWAVLLFWSVFEDPIALLSDLLLSVYTSFFVQEYVCKICMLCVVCFGLVSNSVCV